MMKGKIWIYGLPFLCVVLLVFSTIVVGYAESSSVTPPDSYFDNVNKEIAQWDALGEGYESIFSNWFVGGVRLFGWEKLPLRRLSAQSGIVYYNYVDFMTFILPKNHKAGTLSFNVWGHSDVWQSSKVQFITSVGEFESGVVGTNRGESVWSIQYEYKPVYGPAASVSIPVSEDVRFIWIYTENAEIAITDILFVEQDILPEEDRGSEEETDKDGNIDVLESASRDDTVYVNEKFGFSITASKNWQKEDDPDVLLLLREINTSSAFWVMARQVSETSDLAQFVQETEKTLGYEVLSERNVVIDSVAGIEKVYRFAGDSILMRLKMVYLKKGQIVYALVGGTWEPLFPDMEADFDSIISSFAFIDSVTYDTADIDIPMLSSSGITFASSVRGRRDLTRRPGSIFVQREVVHAYTEISNFRIWRDEDSQFIASLSTEIKVMDEANNVIFKNQQEYGRIFSDLSEIPAYVYFDFVIQLEENIPPGRYKVEIQVRDNVSQQSVPVYGWFNVSKG